MKKKQSHELKEVKRNIFSIVGFCMLITLMSVGCTYCNKKFNIPDDSLPEEVVEFIIKKQTGARIDLTPESPEK